MQPSRFSTGICVVLDGWWWLWSRDTRIAYLKELGLPVLLVYLAVVVYVYFGTRYSNCQTRSSSFIWLWSSIFHSELTSGQPLLGGLIQVFRTSHSIRWPAHNTAGMDDMICGLFLRTTLTCRTDRETTLVHRHLEASHPCSETIEAHFDQPWQIEARYGVIRGWGSRGAVAVLLFPLYPPLFVGTTNVSAAGTNGRLDFSLGGLNSLLTKLS